MNAVATSRQNRGQHPTLRILFTLLTLGLFLALIQGCERSETLRDGEAGSTSHSENLPFHEDSVPDSNQGVVSTAVVSNTKQLTSLPFRASPQPRLLIAGTLLTVQLQESLLTARAHAGDQFSAVITTPLTAGPDILVDSGTAVKGRIESERSQIGNPGQSSGAGYFRLTLSSITVEGRPLAVRTSSLFARGIVQPKGIAVQKGHRLTFRLMDPVLLDDIPTTANSYLTSPASR